LNSCSSSSSSSSSSRSRIHGVLLSLPNEPAIGSPNERCNLCALCECELVGTVRTCKPWPAGSVEPPPSMAAGA
jgi:hypothetical protein